jgi:hypothetical protein
VPHHHQAAARTAASSRSGAATDAYFCRLISIGSFAAPLADAQAAFACARGRRDDDLFLTARLRRG